MSVQKQPVFYSKEALKRLYEKSMPSFSAVLETVQTELKKNVSCVSTPAFKYRVKTFKSYYRKLVKMRPTPSPLMPLLTDILGIRIICSFLEDIRIVEKYVLDTFDVFEVERKGADRTFSEFGYESVHILVHIPQPVYDECVPPDLKDAFQGPLLCEIQIRTILQDAWAEVEHELVYKSEFSPFDLPLRRKLASMNAMLSLADIVFQEIRDYQNKLNSELDLRRSSFYGQADILSAGKLDAGDEINKSSPLLKELGNASPYVQGTVDDMLLEALHSHNIGDLDKAIDIYTRILDTQAAANPIVLSVIYKHRGMAYFAQNDYEKAKKDFLTSVEKDVNNYMALYYVGIIYSVLNEEKQALVYFDRALEKNAYQPHVYYRKALALFRLNRFAESSQTLDIGVSLGLKDSESVRLRRLLEEKLDIMDITNGNR
ncbi:tetratricopeptide repeat protein [Treponema sp. OMZ 840]|uniref:(p)ppGpp synthetase n=1 Tax=Treponema sp. OMZ 840 TaxID=244313 RepID=UPI003D8AB71E